MGEIEKGSYEKYRKCLNLLGDPKGTRTPVPGVRGRCPRPLDDGAGEVLNYIHNQQSDVKG